MHQRCNEIIAERDQAAYKRSQPVKPIDVTVMLVMHRRDKRDPSHIPLARVRTARTRDEAGITASKTLHIFRLGLKFEIRHYRLLPTSTRLFHRQGQRVARFVIA